MSYERMLLKDYTCTRHKTETEFILRCSAMNRHGSISREVHNMQLAVDSRANARKKQIEADWAEQAQGYPERYNPSLINLQLS